MQHSPCYQREAIEKSISKLSHKQIEKHFNEAITKYFSNC